MLLFIFQFSVFLGIIFFLELTAGVLAFVFKDWIKDQLNFFINNNIRAYRDDIDLQNLIDFTQEYVSSMCLFCVVVFALKESYFFHFCESLLTYMQVLLCLCHFVVGVLWRFWSG